MRENILQQIAEKTKNFEKNHSLDVKKPIKEMSMREIMGVMRKKINENAEMQKTVTQAEIDREQEKMLNYFQDDNVDIKFEPLEVYPDGIFWGGSIDGQLLFVYRVTPEERTSGVEVKYLDGFDPSDPDNDKIIKKVQSYYNDFYKYWRDNQLQITN